MFPQGTQIGRTNVLSRSGGGVTEELKRWLIDVSKWDDRGPGQVISAGGRTRVRIFCS